MSSLVVDFDDEDDLKRRQSFFVDRAEAHDQATDMRKVWHTACSGNLLRDAAAIAVLRGEGEEAISLFTRAGERLTSIGIFAGLRLLEFGGVDSVYTWLRNRPYIWSYLSDATKPERRPASADPGDGTQFFEPFVFASASSPRQLLYLYQMLRSFPGQREEVRQVLDRYSEMLIWPTGISMGRYCTLFDAVANITVLSPDAVEVFSSMVLRRREGLATAQSDRWHWRMLLNPAALIDLDFVMIAAVGSGSTKLFEEFVQNDPSGLMALPLRAAHLLRDAHRTRRRVDDGLGRAADDDGLDQAAD